MGMSPFQNRKLDYITLVYLNEGLLNIGIDPYIFLHDAEKKTRLKSHFLPLTYLCKNICSV